LTTYTVKLATTFHHIIPKLKSGHEKERINACILLYHIFTSNMSLKKMPSISKDVRAGTKSEVTGKD
jgi:hypothetical protein